MPSPNCTIPDFEPSFSLGLDESQAPSFSLGLEDQFPPTQHTANSRNAQDFIIEDSESEDMPRRRFKRLRRGPKSEILGDPATPPISTEPNNFRGGSSMETAIHLDDRDDFLDDIEEFSSEDDEPKSHNVKSYSALKFVNTPPALDRRGCPVASPHSSVSVKKSSLGSKEVKFQGFENQSSSRFERPVYEFRDNQFFVEEPLPPDTTINLDSQVKDLLRRRLPHFSFIDDLQTEDEPVYIDYRGQFGNPSTGGRSRNKMQGDGFKTVEKPPNSRTPKGRKPRARSNKSSQAVPQQQNVASNGRKGYWLTEGRTKVYVTADGQRLSGQQGYKQYMKENGKLPRRSQKAKQPKQPKQPKQTRK